MGYRLEMWIRGIDGFAQSSFCFPSFLEAVTKLNDVLDELKRGHRFANGGDITNKDFHYRLYKQNEQSVRSG